METKKTKTVISEEAKLRAKNYMRLKDGYVETKQELERGITITHVDKQETLEESAEKRYPFENGFQVMDIDISEMLQLAFINGAKWQQQNSYSEEEAGELVYNVIGEYAKDYGIMIDGTKLNELFEQLKKK